MIAAFPDCSFGLDKMVAEGDTVVVTGRMRGTHTGTYRGVAATGKKMDIGFMIMYRIANEKFVKVWDHGDYLVMMQQLGAFPKE